MNEFAINIEQQLSRLGRDIQDFVEKVIPLHEREGDFSPFCDIVESDNEIKIYLDLPGIEKKDIRIALKDQVLRISGERSLEVQEGEELKRSERRGGAFSRSFALPEEAKASKTEAHFRGGVLKITVPKTVSSEDSRSIPIH
ncbi:MAG: Hsp20/alpha crystallin family protein [Balneolaceae bacterium]